MKRSQKCFSVEKGIYDSSVKKHKGSMEIQCKTSAENRIIRPVSLIRANVISEPNASTSACVLSSNESENVIHKIFLKTTTEEVKANQSVTPKKLYSPHRDVEKPLASSKSSNLPKNNVKYEDIIGILNKLNTRLEKLEENQNTIMVNQKMLSNGQISIASYQQAITTKLEEIEAKIVSKPEIIAQTKLMMECKTAIKKVENSVSCMTGEVQVEHLDEVVSMLPLKTIAKVQELEKKLKTPDFAAAMTTYLYKLKGASEDVSSIIRALFTDNLLEKYNWDGRKEKFALGKLILFNQTLRDVFQQQGAYEFEKSVRRAVELSHHRVKQKKYLSK